MSGNAGWLGVSFLVLAVGCGGFKESVYDVELNAEDASAIPYSCEDGEAGRGPPQPMEMRQQWTFRADDMRSTRIEVPSVHFDFLDGIFGQGGLDYGRHDEPIVFPGTSSAGGPFQFVDITTRTLPADALARYVLRYYVDNDSLEDDAIHGFVDVREERIPGGGTCTYVMRFTGRRVK
ncbi:hypothetical protein [Myxococcus eversor]|uniref:hypothetical protein n=1 Tax=Myxococcus eversor TaxID=2709661 RepID=UPI0013D794CD|nr:hypothetical protein [Myxococcus eversor]